MKKQWKGFVCGFMVAILIIGMGTTALAATVRQLNAEYSGIKIMLDGEEFIPRDVNGTVVEPFIVSGTTYLPVRAVASAFGLDVAWDGATQTVILTTPGKEPVATGYGRTNPAPVGTWQKVTVDNYSYSYTVTICVEDVLSGKEMERIMGSTVANDSPDEGCEIVAVKVKILLDDVSTDRSISFGKFDFDSFTSNNESLDSKYVYLNEGYSLNSTLYEGGEATGYITMQRKIGDAGAKIVYGQEYDGSGGIWFSIAG